MKALICGAGIAGLTTAWWLDHTGWDVIVVEQAPALRDGGYMIDFWDAGYDVAERMGLRDRVHDVAHGFDRVRYVDAAGREVSHLDYGAFSRMQGGRLATLLRGDLEGLLHAAVADRVAIRYATSIARIGGAPTRPSVTLTDGTTVAVDLVVGADGVHSHVRGLVFGPEDRFVVDLGLHTSAYVVEDPGLSDRMDGSFVLHTAPGRIVGCYPMGDGRANAFFADRGPAPAAGTDPRDRLRATYGDLGWVVPRLLARCPEPPQLYDDRVAQVRMERWHRGRVVLVGDACQAVSLLAGQGASMAVAGGHVLATELAATGDVDAGLDAYAERLRPAIAGKQAAGRRTAGWFVPASRARILARDAVLRLAAFGPLERLLRPVLTTPGGDVVRRGAGVTV